MDLILEGSRQFIPAKDVVIKLYNFCRQSMGPQCFVHRKDYLTEFYGMNPSTTDYAFSQVVWHYSVILRICFRETLCRQVEEQPGMDNTVKAMVFELEKDLNSSDFRIIVNRLSQQALGGDLLAHQDPTLDVMLFSLLVYHFCQHLITLLKSTNIINAAATSKSVWSAKLLVSLIRIHPEWLVPATSQTHLPRALAGYFIPRILWIAGLSLGQDKESEGTCTPYSINHIY